MERCADDQNSFQWVQLEGDRQKAMRRHFRTESEKIPEQYGKKQVGLTVGIPSLCATALRFFHSEMTNPNR